MDHPDSTAGVFSDHLSGGSPERDASLRADDGTGVVVSFDYTDFRDADLRAIDIDADNRVASTRVADAHIRYTGKGEIARASRQGWLQRFFSILSPF